MGAAVGWISNSTTGRDNKTHDIVRIAIALVTLMLPLILIWGMLLETWATLNQKPFDMNAFFMGIGTFLTLFGAFLASSSVGILLKKTTEPDGTQTTVESITEGRQPDITRVTKTNVIAEPGSTIISPQDGGQQ